MNFGGTAPLALHNSVINPIINTLKIRIMEGNYPENHCEWSIDVEVVDRMNLEGGSSC